MTTEDLISMNMKLIYKAASGFYGVEKEDLVQAGITGLLKAKERYKEDKSAKFSTYAYFDICGEMHKLANKKLIKVSADILKMYKIIEKTRYDEAQKIGKLPTNEELSIILNMPLDTIDYACMSACTIMSTDEENENNRNINETISCEDTVSVDDRILLNECINNLTIDERNVIEERYFLDKTQSEVARTLNMSQVMVSRLESKGIQNMRRYVSM